MAADRADRVVVLQNGLLAEQGLATNILSAPRQEYTRRLVAAVPSLDGTPGHPACAGAGSRR